VRRKNSEGFSIIELLIVVAVILIITAFSIPNFLRSMIAANQASAISSLRILNTAELSYSVTFNSGFSSTLADLAPPTVGGTPTSTAAGLIDSILARGRKSGYTFTYSAGAPDSTGHIDTYTITAVPISNNTGTNCYFMDQSGVIRQNATTTAGSTDSPIPG